ncbi:hypothetical protein CSPX01_11036 [Colletotrichum filicis]|nr:hypothetical protein CSPX01_11036 [Colletotrichum filicis]
MSRIFVGILTQKVSTIPSVLNETLLPMAPAVDRRQEQYQMTHPESESEDGNSVWNQSVEGIFHPVISQVPDRWDDHISVALSSRTTTESLLEVRSLEDGNDWTKPRNVSRAAPAVHFMPKEAAIPSSSQTMGPTHGYHSYPTLPT